MPAIKLENRGEQARSQSERLEPENAFQLHQAVRRVSAKTHAEDAGWSMDGVGNESRPGGRIDVMARIGEVRVIGCHLAGPKPHFHLF